MCLYSIATEYNGPLKAAHVQIDNDNDEMVIFSAAGQLKLKLDLSDQLRGYSIASTHAILLSSANVLV